MFNQKLKKELSANFRNNYTSENHDSHRFGKYAPAKNKNLKTFLKQIIKHALWVTVGRKYLIHRAMPGFDRYLPQLNAFYRLLDDEPSRDLLVKLVAYRIFGPKKVKLPTNAPSMWDKVREIEKLGDKKNTIPLNRMGWELVKTNLSSIGYPVVIYYMANGIYITFLLQQYRYKTEQTCIEAQEGDVVLDLGGCYGDTALYFASKVKSGGHVYAFEFIPNNLKILKKNLALNPDMKGIVSVVESPVWNTSGLPVYFTDHGPGSRVSLDDFEAREGKTETLSIDDFVKKEGLERVNFIKMDIEGAEPKALEGAAQTLRKHKPKLAIAIYHSMNDFVNIVQYLEGLRLGYKFYLGHYTIHAEETVLYAT